MALVTSEPTHAAAAIFRTMSLAAMEVAEEILAASQEEVPVDTGDLKSSGRIYHTTTGLAIEYKAMNGDENYAIIQHEDTTLNHPNGGKAHYLRDPALRIGAQLPQRIAEWSRR